MSDTSLTKAELAAIIDVQRESASHMAKIAGSLADILKTQENLVSKFNDVEKVVSNDLIDKVATKVDGNCKNRNTLCCNALADITKTMDKVENNTTWLTIIVGGAALIIIIAVILLKVVFPSNHQSEALTRDDVKSLLQELHNDEQLHSDERMHKAN